MATISKPPREHNVPLWQFDRDIAIVLFAAFDSSSLLRIGTLEFDRNIRNVPLPRRQSSRMRTFSIVYVVSAVGGVLNRALTT
jgi:hypothetical protein